MQEQEKSETRGAKPKPYGSTKITFTITISSKIKSLYCIHNGINIDDLNEKQHKRSIIKFAKDFIDEFINDAAI